MGEGHPINMALTSNIQEVKICIKLQVSKYGVSL